MGKPISYFSNYHGRENTVTNYCGLMMKMVYEESPLMFQEVMASLLEGKVSLQVGPIFAQQTKRIKKEDTKETRLVPDLEITQESFNILFETKLTDWFYNAQIKNYIDCLSEAGKNIIFLLTNWEDEGEINSDLETEEMIQNSNCNIITISFEDLVGSIEKVTESAKSERLKYLLSEFSSYLDVNNLLPRWKYMLDVANCTRTLEKVSAGAYICPDTGGPYSHRRAKYFGPYANKKVKMIYEIDGLVSFGKNMKDPKIKWNNNNMKDKELIKKAKDILKNCNEIKKENETTPLQIFLLGKGEETNFEKGSSGGMQSSKIYFWDIGKDLKENTVSNLAEKVNGKKWEDFR